MNILSKILKSSLVIGFGFLSVISTAQNFPLIIELEDGTVGNEISILEDGGVTYITAAEDGAGDSPANINRVVQLQVNFEYAQGYDLYVRYRVGSGLAVDDSFFYGNGFGDKNISSANDWVRVNNIHSIGYIGAGEVVEGGGGAGTEVWKWINLSQYLGDEAPFDFDVESGALSQVFQIGTREDGLDIDKIAFCRSGVFFTVENLENVEEGTGDNTGGNTGIPIAEGKSKFLGNVYSSAQASGFAGYWNQVTPENGGKWGSVEGTRDNMNWGTLDAAYNLAKDNDFYFKFHVLIWGNQQPAWIANLSDAEQLEEIKEWYQAVADRYPDIDAIEVVNEPLHDPPNSSEDNGGNYINALGGTGSTGYDWVITSFTLAREYFPNAKLMLNDYNIVNNFGAVTNYLKIINLLKDRGLIDQIGVQAHAFSTRGAASTMKNNLDRLAETGLPIYATEMDIDGPTDAEQLADYKRIFTTFWEHPAVKGVTLWGYRTGLWRQDEMAYIIDTDGVTERPALIWLREYVEGLSLSTKAIKLTDNVTISPNPISNHSFSIKGLSDVQKIDLYDFQGRLIHTQSVINDFVELPYSIKGGMYLISIFTENGFITKKVILNY